MQTKQDSDGPSTQQQTIRYKILLLFSLNSPNYTLPFGYLQLILQVFNFLQVMKFPIDNYASYWVGSSTTIMSNLDPAYHISKLDETTKVTFVVALTIIINVYYIALIVAYLLSVQYTQFWASFRKLTFLFYRHIIVPPSFALLVKLLRPCEPDTTACIKDASTALKAVFLLSFIVLLTFIWLQSYICFDFLPIEKKYTRLRRYSQGPLAFGTFFMLSEFSSAMLTGTAQLIALNTITLLFVIFLFWKDEQIDQTSKLIQLACLWMVMLAYICVDFMALTKATIEIYVYLLVTVAVTVGVMRLRTYSIKFQLQNINKWPTLEIMIRQQSTLRYYLSRGDEYLFKVWIHGYMQIHRQKCDNIACPSRCKLSQYDQKLLSLTDNRKKNQQLIRINNIMKVIFTAGYKLNPVPGQIQLQYTIYLYQRGQYELSLRKLLLIDYQELTFDRYYIYTYLKELLSNKIKSSRGEQFLDMVREMMLKREQQLLLKKFQKAAFLNLQFWSILNQDHPDFQKLNEVASTRLQVSHQINSQFQLITGYAHSQKLTNIYAYYLQHLQNDELLHHSIYQNIMLQYKLNQQILVQDWSNSSINVILASLQQSTYGKMIEINTSCASLFGYQKHQLINQSLSILYPDDLITAYMQLVHLQANGDVVWLVNKSDYLVQVRKVTKIYNSINTGATALICLEKEKSQYSCQIILDRNSKIIAHSSSMIALLGLDLRYYEGETFAYQFFNKNLTTLDQHSTYRSDELIKTDFLEGVRKNTTFSLKNKQKYNCFAVQIKCNQLPSTKVSKIIKQNSSSFQFRIEATLTEFKYIGCYTNEQSFISQFSQFQQSSLQRAQSQKINYAKDISTVRLKDNIIQLIEQNQQNESQQFIRHEQNSSHALIALSRKDQEQIFSDKKAYKQFLDKHPIGRSVYIMLLLSVGVIFGLYIGTFVVERSQASKSYFYASESIYQNLIISTITQQSRYIRDMQLTATNKSITTPQHLLQQFNNNLAQLQNIQLLGSSPFQISLTINNSTSTYLTSQYISTLINYAITFSNLLQNVKSNQDLQGVFANVDSYTLKYLLSAEEVKYQMVDAFSQRQQKMKDVIDQAIVVQKVLLAMGIILIVAIAVIFFACFNYLSKERVRVFEIFLEISEQQLQHFSSKTEKFLVSLHSQEQNGEVEHDLEAGKKTQSSHFAKKKSFKLIKANILYYIKLSIVLLLMLGFFIHSYMISLQNSQFHAKSIDYYARTANIKYSISNTANKMILSALNNVTIDYHQTSYQLRVYYRSYFNLHDLTFGTLTNFQTTFQSLLTGNLCQGSSTPYGFMSIPRACEIPQLSANGTYLVLSGLLSFIDQGVNNLMEEQTHICYQVLGDAQQILSTVVLAAQTDFINSINDSLLTALLLWLGISGLAALVIWGREVQIYLKELNQIRHILGILPLRLVKQMPLALKYIKATLQRSNGIF